MEPGEIYPFEIDMAATAQTFLAGHRIRIHVTSSDFPWLDRTLNTGGPFGEEAEQPSHVVLPIMKS